MVHKKVVFDASALIILFAKEPGYETIRQYMERAIISSVNIAEVHKYCIESQRLMEDECRSLVMRSGIQIIAFCQEQALITVSIVGKKKNYGLSLGDRACIALAMLKSYPVLTCDKIWQKVDIDVPFLMAR
jgi:PIN domain nuclease of toxin-antitoxin system